jgi:hypothetical protein
MALKAAMAIADAPILRTVRDVMGPPPQVFSQGDCKRDQKVLDKITVIGSLSKRLPHFAGITFKSYQESRRPPPMRYHAANVHFEFLAVEGFMRKSRKIGWLAAVAAGFGLAVMGSTASATVITPTYTADGPSFPGTPAINTTGSASGAVNSNFTINAASTGSSVIDQTFFTGPSGGGTLNSISFYTSGTGGTGTTGSGLTMRLYQLGTPGTQASGGFQGGGDSDTYVFPNASIASNTPGSNPDLLAAYSPTFDISPSPNNRYATVDLTGAGVTLLPNTSYAVELQGNTSDTLYFPRAGVGNLYTGGNLYGGTAGTTTTTNRGLPNSGGPRDGAFAVYVTAPVPEPTALGLIGLTATALLGRRRKA